MILVPLLLATVVGLVWGQQTCPDKFEQMMRCMTKLGTNKDYNTILDKKMNTARTCGATDKNIQCWKAMYKCWDVAEASTRSSPTYNTAKAAAIQCYNNNPNNPLAGLEMLFTGGMMGHHGGKGRHGGMGGMGNKGMGVTGLPGGQGNDHDDSDSNSDEDGGDDDYKFPADCKPNDWKNLHNCTMQNLQRDQGVITAAGRLRPLYKQCKDMITADCKPESKPLGQCLWKALDPIMKSATTSFNTCMSTAGFN